MKVYKNILLATNLRNESKIVAERAVSLAEKFSAKLNIVHVYEFSPLMYGMGEYAIPTGESIKSQIIHPAKDALAAESSRLGIKPENQFLESRYPAETLPSLVKKIKCDLLVVGNHMHYGLSYFIGSTTNTMLHIMPCDILAVYVA